MHQNSLMEKQFKSHPDCCNLLSIKPPCLDVSTWVCLAIGPVHLVIVAQQVIVALVETLGEEGGRAQGRCFSSWDQRLLLSMTTTPPRQLSVWLEEINVCAFVGVEGGGWQIHPTQRDVENNTGESSQSIMW